jgi:agmatine/peptidylarginine deiminase
MTPDEFLRRSEIGRGFTPTPPPPAPVTNLAEFNYNEGVLIRYPFGIPMALIKKMSEVGIVITIVANQSAQNTVYNQYVNNGVNLTNCSFLIAPTDSYWTRDYGPWFVINGENKVGIVDFPYNRPRPSDDDIPVKMASFMDVPLYGMNIIHTGGNYMCDGMEAAASTNLVYSENPSLSPSQIHQMMNDYLGIINYHVRPDPNGTYIDHIDCWAKFLDVDKILVRQVPSSHPQYNLIEQAAAYWQSAISSYGTPYQVFRVNTPNNQPYTNSFILKDHVFVPFTGNTLYDNEALQAYQNAMPGYQIIGVYQNPSTPWESTDALHCRTHEVADKYMLFIKHLPIVHTQPCDEDYLITTYIKSLCDSAIIADSTRVFYSIDNGPYQIIPLSYQSNDQYTALIPRQPAGSSIRYFLQAAEKSGRNMYHPFIGVADPHNFMVGEGIHPHITLSTHSVDTSSNPGQVVNFPISITNVGYADLAWILQIDSASSSWLYSSDIMGTLSPGSTQDITLTLDATFLSPALYESKISIQSNDPDQPVDNILVHFNVFSGIGIHNEIDWLADCKIGPNPFSNQLLIEFRLNQSIPVIIEIYNSSGYIVKTISKGYLPSGVNHFIWNTPESSFISLPDGLYLVKISTDKSHKLIKVIHKN